MITRIRKATGLKRGKNSKPKKINFQIIAPEANTVFLVGDFNDWNVSAHPCKPNTKGIWKTCIKLDSGRYEYRFLVEEEWKNNPECVDFVPNPFGSKNCVITVE